MNRKRFQEFSNYLHGFTQRIVERFPDSTNFIEEEKRQMLERYPELSGVKEPQQTKEQNINVIKLSLGTSYDPKKREDYFGVEHNLRRDTPEQVIESINYLSRAIGNCHKDILFYSALQGKLLSLLKEVCGQNFSNILKNCIELSRSHSLFLMKFKALTEKYPKLLQCDLPINFFYKNFKFVEHICESNTEWHGAV